MILTTSSLLSMIRTKSALTNNQAGLSNDEVLNIASTVLTTDIVSLVVSFNEGYFLFTEKMDLEAGRSRYRLPSRASVLNLHHIYWEGPDGQRSDLVKLQPVDVVAYNDTVTADIPESFLIESNHIRVYPAVSGNPKGQLVLIYHFKPNALTLESNGRSIVAVSGQTITLPSIPASWNVTKRLDIISHLNGNEIVQYGLGIASISGNDITLMGSLEGVEAGNHVCLEGYSFVPMIPEDFHPLLVEMTVLQLAKARNDEIRIQQSLQRIKEMTERLSIQIDRRVETKADVVRVNKPFIPALRTRRAW